MRCFLLRPGVWHLLIFQTTFPVRYLAPPVCLHRILLRAQQTYACFPLHYSEQLFLMWSLFPVYINSLLAVLNTREALRKRNTGMHSIPQSPSSMHFTSFFAATNPNCISLQTEEKSPSIAKPQLVHVSLDLRYSTGVVYYLHIVYNSSPSRCCDTLYIYRYL